MGLCNDKRSSPRQWWGRPSSLPPECPLSRRPSSRGRRRWWGGLSSGERRASLAEGRLTIGPQVGNLHHRRLGYNTNLPNIATPKNLRRVRGALSDRLDISLPDIRVARDFRKSERSTVLSDSFQSIRKTETA